MKRNSREPLDFLSKIFAGVLLPVHMKLHSLVLTFFVSLGLGVPAIVSAEAPQVDKIIELLHQAKGSSDPVPLLQKAHKELVNFKAAPNATKEYAPGIGRRGVSSNAVAAHEHKQKALEAIQAAIDTAKSGGEVKPKIEHAVAMVHEAGNLKR